MMHRPLRIIDILTHAAEFCGDQGLVSARVEGDIHRQSYTATLARVAQLAHASRELGIGTLAWNGHRHFELYYGVAGLGAVCHTINPRLSQEQLIYIIRHAGDRMLFLDLTFVSLVETLLPDLPEDLRLVLMTDRAHMPKTTLDVRCYEDLLVGQPTEYHWPDLPEETASGLCYTSGTTGQPKGALYSQRSTVLHAMQVPMCQTSSFRAGRRVFGVEFKIVDEAGQRLPHDGVATGELYVRGNTVISGYFENAGASDAAMDADGWFGTGDVASVGPDGQLIIRDRAKDLVKSGGEWISYIDLENAAFSHPAIHACAVIAVTHPIWDERLVLLAVAAGEARPALDEMRAHMAPHFADWQLPDDLVWVADLPLTATGKMSKLTLRGRFTDYGHLDLRGSEA
jgi:acyl-CoA synthetase (AMP-forming)/AMP-acid ligase II